MGHLNQALFETIYAWGHRSIFATDITIFFAAYLPYFLGAGALVFILSFEGWRRRTFLLIEASLSILLSRGIFTYIIQSLYTHPRPSAMLGIIELVHESSNSFPSGHAAFFFALATTIFFYNRHWGGWYFFLGALNGFARIAAGVHWPLDIVGGALIGIGSGIGIHLLLKSSWNLLHHHEAPAPETTKKP
jgi:undecaprenyl-diphosphatase